MDNNHFVALSSKLGDARVMEFCETGGREGVSESLSLLLPPNLLCHSYSSLSFTHTYGGQSDSRQR